MTDTEDNKNKNLASILKKQFGGKKLGKLSLMATNIIRSGFLANKGKKGRNML